MQYFPLFRPGIATGAENVPGGAVIGDTRVFYVFVAGGLKQRTHSAKRSDRERIHKAKYKRESYERLTVVHMKVPLLGEDR